MALNMGQWNVGGTIATTVVTMNIPPGPYNMTVYNTGSATFYMGIGTSPTSAPPGLTTSSGMVMHSIPTSWNGYQGAGGGFLWVIASTAPSAFNYILSTQER
jgi:hypothetical protein